MPETSEVALHQIAQEFLAQCVLKPRAVRPLKDKSLAENASRSTRKPNPYDRHMPRFLQPRSISFNNFWYSQENNTPSKVYIDKLLTRPTIKKLLLEQSSTLQELNKKWRVILDEIGQLSAKNELDVQYAQVAVAKVACDLASLIVFDFTENQLKQSTLWRLLVPRSSNTIPKADILIGIADDEELNDMQVALATVVEHDSGDDSANNHGLHGRDDDERRHLSLSEVRDEVLIPGTALEPYVETVVSIECKQIKFGQPMAYLTFLLLIWLNRTQKLPSFWPGLKCVDCGKFATSHAVMRHVPDADVLTRYHPLDGMGGNFGDDRDRKAVLKTEIRQVLASVQPGRDDAAESKTVTRTGGNRGEFYKAVYPAMAELWSAESEFLRDLHRAKLEIHHVMCWATIARDILVQDWAQMVHHNTTLSMVSSHNTGFAAQRLRKDQQVVIYPLSKASDPDYLIEQALLIARSLEDGQERYEYHTSKAHPHWVDNFVKSAKDQTIIDQANAMQQPRLTRGQTDTVNTVLKRNRDDHDGDGGGGSGVAGGHGTGHASSSGSTYSGGDAAGGSSSSTSGAMQQGRSNKKARNAADIDPKKLHLGFKCIAHCLLSDGFSKYKRISMADNDSDSDSDSPIPTPQVATPLLPHTPPSSSRGLPLSQAMAADTFTGRPRSTSVAWSTASESSTVQSDRSSSSFVTSSGASSPYTTLSESSPKSLRVAPRIEQSTISSKPTITKVGLILTDMVAQSQAGIRVWAGNMYLEGLDVPEDINPLSIIVKLSEWSTNPDVPDGTESKGGSQLRGEAKIYEHIKNVAANWQSTSQSDLDSIVCHYYGLYNDSGSLALVLDNGGDRLPFRKWQDCKDVQLKKDIYEKVVELHTNWGVKHNDVKPRNIVKAEGVIRIIDFHTSEIHVCQGPQLCEELMALRQELEQ